MLPKEKRKDEFRKRKTSMEVEHEDREKKFLASLSEQHEIALRRISEIYREKMAATEKSYLQQKQTVRKQSEACGRGIIGDISNVINIVSKQSKLFSGDENSRGHDVGVGGETHSREASALEETCKGTLLYAAPSDDNPA